MLSTANSDSAYDAGDSDAKMKKKVQGRKRRVLWGFRAAAISYAGASGLALRKSGITSSSCYTIAGPLMAAGMAHILSGASQKDRLSSTTYKRLNIVLAKYGAIGLLVSALSRKSSSAFWYFWTTLSFVTMVNSIKGYGYGVKGWKLEGGMRVIKDDLWSQIKNTAKSIFSPPPNLQSMVYICATGTVLTLSMKELFEASKLLSLALGSESLKIVPHLSRCGRLLLLTGASFTLKDAADRGHLEGTTFIELNLLSSLAFGTWAVFLRDSVGSVTPLVRVTGFFSVITSLFAGMGWVYKKNKESYHDETLKDGRAQRLSDDFPLEE